MKYIDNFLNAITMYRLVLYGLTVLVVISIGFGFAGVLPLNGLHMLSSLVILLASCGISNYLLGKLFKIPVNTESVFITAYILFLILPPATTIVPQLTLVLAGIIAMSSKFVLNIKGKHIFNPAAIAALVIGLAGLMLPTWWVGSAVLLPVVGVFGLLVVRKIRHFDLFLTFCLVALVAIVATNMSYGGTFIVSFKGAFTSWPLVFFGTIMLTEPITSPPARIFRMMYGAIVALLFSISFHVGAIYSTPELALIIGNLFSYVVSPKERLVLTLKEKIKSAPMVYDFIFTANRPMKFMAGQYLEWTLGHKNSDSRGNRRYFTIASAPSEKEIRLGVKVPDESSSFKKALLEMQPGDELMAGALAGEFNLPKDTNKKIVAIAGGVGITPFRSMVKHMIETNEKRDLVLLYVCNNESEFVYKDVFDAAQSLGVKPVYMTSFITEETITKEVTDFKNRLYYISGPPGMVQAYKKLLTSMGVSTSAITTDYFPGY